MTPISSSFLSSADGNTSPATLSSDSGVGLLIRRVLEAAIEEGAMAVGAVEFDEDDSGEASWVRGGTTRPDERRAARDVRDWEREVRRARGSDGSASTETWVEEEEDAETFLLIDV